MTTKYLEYCMNEKLPCCWGEDKTVYIAVDDIELLNDDAVCPVLEGLVCQAYQPAAGCSPQWNYTFSYDDTQLADPSTPLIASQVLQVWCNTPFVQWILCKITNA